MKQSLTFALSLFVVLTACSDPSRVAGALTEGRQPEALHVPGPETFAQASVGGLQTCALRADGAMQCWGDNTDGAAPSSQQAGIGYFTAIDAGTAHTCAVRIDGAIECFGAASPFGHTDPLYIPASGSFVDVGAGRYNTCGLRDDGVVECYGESTASPQPVVTATTGSFTQLGVGEQHGCALRTDGAVQCWGGFAPALEAPAFRLASTGAFTQVSSGTLFSCGLRNDGAIECWGYGHADGRDPALKTAASGHFTQLTAGTNHGCALRDDGKVECWGANEWGEAPSLKVASNGGRFTEVVTSFRHTCGLRDDMTIQCWGLRPGTGPGTTVNPVATFVVPSSIVVRASLTLAFTDAKVPGHPRATSFTYGYDCVGNGHFTRSSSSTFSCPMTVTGTRSVNGIVYDEDGDWTAYHATVIVKEPAEATTDLKTSVSTAALAPDLRKALTSKLNAAFDAIASGKTKVACSALQDFINQVKAQTGKAIDAATAALWIQQASDLRASLGC